MCWTQPYTRDRTTTNKTNNTTLYELGTTIHKTQTTTNKTNNTTLYELDTTTHKTQTTTNKTNNTTLYVLDTTIHKTQTTHIVLCCQMLVQHMKMFVISLNIAQIHILHHAGMFCKYRYFYHTYLSI